MKDKKYVTMNLAYVKFSMHSFNFDNEKNKNNKLNLTELTFIRINRGRILCVQSKS